MSEYDPIPFIIEQVAADVVIEAHRDRVKPGVNLVKHETRKSWMRKCDSSTSGSFFCSTPNVRTSSLALAFEKPETGTRPARVENRW